MITFVEKRECTKDILTGHMQCTMNRGWMHTVTRRWRGNREYAFLNAALKFTHIHDLAPLKWK